MLPILNENLGFRKLSASWVLRFPTIDHKRNRVTSSEEYLALFNFNPDEFVLFRNRGRNLDPPPQTGDQRVAETVVPLGESVSDEGKLSLFQELLQI